MKSTLGPWMNREGYYGQGETAEVITTVFEHKTFINSMMQKTIAHMDAVMWAEKDSEEVEEMKANAILIAESPNLLEALRRVANISRYPISDPENIAFALETAREIARAAMAKAEGKPDRQEEI